MIKFKNTGNVDTRSGFGEGLLELGKENKNRRYVSPPVGSHYFTTELTSLRE